MQRILFIANPISGTNDKRPVIEAIPRYLNASAMEWDVVWTDHRGHAAELAEKAAGEGVDVCVAIGGDGTVNEVARSLRHSPTALGIIPMGSGNGLARHLGIPMDPDRALAVIAECRIEALDYGLIDDHPFFCTCGMGFDAFISEKFANAGKRGLLTYIDQTLRGGLAYQPETYELEIDDRREHYKAFLIAIGNASQYGNNFYIAPSASMSDGLLDVTIMEPFNMLNAPQIVVQMLNRTLDTNSHIRTFQCKHLRVHRTQPGVIHYDGDPAEAPSEIDIHLVPKGLRVVVGPNVEAVANGPVAKHIFQDLYDQITADIKSQQRKLARANKTLLDNIRSRTSF